MSRLARYTDQSAYFRRMNWTQVCPVCSRPTVVKAFETSSARLDDDTLIRNIHGRCCACESRLTRHEDDRVAFSAIPSLMWYSSTVIGPTNWGRHLLSGDIGDVMKQQRDQESE